MLEISIVPLYETMSIYVPCESDAGECKIYYKKAGDSSYKRGIDAVYREETKSYASCITGLNEGAEYSIVCMIENNGECYGRGKTSAITKTEDIPISKEIYIGDICKNGEALDLSGYNGTEEGYTRIYGNGNITVDGGESDCTIFGNGAEYILLDSVNVQGGKYSGINLDGCKNVIVRNCDISKWGRTGTLTRVSDSGSQQIQWIDSDGNYINYDAGIRMIDAEKITVEKCFIHEPNGDSTSWSGTENGITWEGSHPVGCCGMYVKGRELVVRYNDIIANENHRFNDAIEGEGNHNKNGGFAADCDIYGNQLSYAQDDAVELDGRCENVRFFGNRINVCRTGVSSIISSVGPAYVFGNLMHDFRDSSMRCEYAFKTGNPRSYGVGMQYVFNNTVYPASNENIHCINYLGCADMFTRNNIFVGANKDIYEISDVEDAESRSNFDYDLLGNFSDNEGKSKLNIVSAESKEENGFFGLPTLPNRNNGIFRLAGASLGKNSSVPINGFIDSGDVGAYYSDDISMIPIRPVSETVDKEYVRLDSNGSITVTLSTDSEEPRAFSIKKNDNENSLVSVSYDKNSVVKGSDVRIAISAGDYAISNQYYDEHIIIKFDDGYSIPIGIRLKK